jgi:ABC-2 type transport system ATP-binding protein
MDEAARCDDLILMRSGEILAAGTPAQLCDAAGAQDIESVFLKLVRARGEAA